MVIELAGSRQNHTPESHQVALNRAAYESRGAYKHYLGETLMPQEIACLLKYQPSFSGGDVLDIGVGAGRTTRYLAPLAKRYEAVDFSSTMVRYMTQAMPEISVRQADFRDLGIFEDASFDFVFAPNNVIDTLSHEERLQALQEACRVLRPNGVLALSSHNVNCERALTRPRIAWCADPIRLAFRGVHYVLCWWNYLRVRPLRRITSEYALLNDNGHYFACLHYYLSRRAMTSQLESRGFQLSDVFSTLGRSLPDGADDREDASLLYVAKRTMQVELPWTQHSWTQAPIRTKLTA